MDMALGNLFWGEGSKPQYAKIIYRWLMSRRWVTYDDIRKERWEGSQENLSCSVSKCADYGELKKAFVDVRNAIIKKAGEESIEKGGTHRNKRFRYVGKDKDPLADIRNAKAVNSLQQYSRFCQDSAGFFPISWLEYFFKDCQDLLNIKSRIKRGEQVISSSLDRILTNIDLLPKIYEAIVNKQVLEIGYKPFGKERKQEALVFHPDCLKEYNGRWHLFGRVEVDGLTTEKVRDLALDRIQSEPRVLNDKEYIPNEDSTYYEKFFRDIVGVSHSEGAVVEHIIVRAHTEQVFGLTDTKPIHPTQKLVTPFGEHKGESYGEFSIDVKVNHELIGRILQMGDGLEVMSPENVRERFCAEAQSLAGLYSEQKQTSIGSKSKRTKVDEGV